jgi:hypothetical protein
MSPIQNFKLDQQRKGKSKKISADRFAASVYPVIRSLQNSGITTLTGLAQAMNDKDIPTSSGGLWYAGAIRNVLDRVENKR